MPERHAGAGKFRNIFATASPRDFSFSCGVALGFSVSGRHSLLHQSETTKAVRQLRRARKVGSIPQE